MSYTLFEICQVIAGDKKVRGARITCSYCPVQMDVAVNSQQAIGKGNDDLVMERHVACKFERAGWRIGKTLHKHTCPNCLMKFKVSSMHRKKDSDTVNVIPLKTPSEEPPRGEREMSRDERRIIFEKLHSIYLNETVGYAEGWNDEKVSVDLGVPRIWVANIRDDMFGPDLGTQNLQEMAEARALLEEIKTVVAAGQSFIDQWHALAIKADTIMNTLRRIEDRK